ncbi:MAG: VOC family protein [Nitrospiraceae bacterium]
MFPFGHIDLRARDVDAVYPFYARILPELGFRNEWQGQNTFSFQAEGKFPKLSWFGVIEDRNHVPNATRIAFAVESCEEVDRLAKIVRAAGAINIEGPEDMPYTRVYYAMYFEDPSGNRLEIYCCEE